MQSTSEKQDHLMEPLKENNINLTNLLKPSSQTMSIDDSIHSKAGANTDSALGIQEFKLFSENSDSEFNLDTPEQNAKSPLAVHHKEDDTQDQTSDEDNFINVSAKKRKTHLILERSDSEDETQTEINTGTANFKAASVVELEETAESKKHKRISMLLDSDSDCEEYTETTPHNKSFASENSNKSFDDEIEHPPIVFKANSKGELVPEANEKIQKSRLAMLCDSEDDSDEDKSSTVLAPINNSSRGSQKESFQESPRKKKGNKKEMLSKLASEEDKPHKMTPKEAAEQRKVIQSESQRMLREKDVSLPYHKPKSRSLQEFLSRRPRLSRAVSEAQRAPPSVAIKMSKEQLELMSKKLKEREKEVKEFYKSESEGSENDDEDYIPPQEKCCSKDEAPEAAIRESEATENVQTATESSEMSAPVKLHEEAVDMDKVQESNSDVNMETNNISSEPSETQNEQPECEPMSESYEFNLEDDHIENMEVTTERNAEVITGQPTTFAYTDLDKEIEDFEETPLVPHKSKLELLKEKLANDKPKLSGGPDEVIDLDEGVAKSKEVVQLMERFAKHVATEKHHHSQHKVKLSVVTVESGGDICKEEVAVDVESDDDCTVIEEKPGAKLQKLKEELQKQMELKKAEIWQQKAAKNFKGEGATEEKDILDDDEEEAELTDEDELDEELEEDDIDLTDKPRNKSHFLDEEAEESDKEESTSTKEGYEEAVEEAEADDASVESDNEEKEEIENVKKPLRRVLKPADDSDDDMFDESPVKQNIQLDSTATADEDEIPSHQPPQLHTPVRPEPSQTTSITDFLTPISFITSIQNLSKSHKDGSVVSPFRMPSDLKSPVRDGKGCGQRNLFEDEVSNSQDQESSSATEAAVESSSNQQSACDEEEQEPTTQDLLEICSGQFTGITQLESREPSSNTFQNSQSSQLKSLGTEDMVISQLLDEEELEKFKRKFDSPITQHNPVTQSVVLNDANEIVGGGVIGSDDEDEEEGGIRKTKKGKNQKRLQFSDDESSSAEEDDQHEEEIDLQDPLDDEEDIDNVGYDSEENEIDLGETGPKEKVKLTDFLEAEAELSESEWGSEDEDEKGLDQMEFELGDTDKLDEEKVKADLEKIHMRRMLDDDTREVKLLQELLLEDGEMHGAGRQRQFKWKNIDLNGDPNEERKDDDDIYMEEEESEEQWRKQRHEREMFLKKQQDKSRGISSQDLVESSQLLKIGQKVLQRSVSLNSQGSTPNEKTDSSPVKNSSLFSLQNKRGSFLNRSDQVLERVAEYTKVSAEIDVDSSRKTTKHFLFQSISVSEVTLGSAETKKRKALEGTPNVLKKLRLSTNLSPAIKKKLTKPERSKKLFD